LARDLRPASVALLLHELPRISNTTVEIFSIEPGPQAWKAVVMLLHYTRFCYALMITSATNRAAPEKNTPGI
jgi:hypothetical protein